MSNFFPVFYTGRLIRYITGRTKGIKGLCNFRAFLQLSPLLFCCTCVVLPPLTIAKNPKYLDKYTYIHINTKRENALERKERASELFLLLSIETRINQYNSLLNHACKKLLPDKTATEGVNKVIHPHQ